MPLLNPTRRKLLGSMFWLYALLGLNAVIPLAVLPYLVRVLGVERFGLVAFAQAFAQYFVILTDYGFNLSATKQTAKVRNDPEQVSRLFWSVMAIKLALMLAGIFLLAIILAIVPRFRHDALLYFVAYLAVVGTVLFPTWLFQGMEQMRYISVVSGGAKLVSAIFLFIVVRGRTDYVYALAILSGGMLLAGVAGFWTALATFHIVYRTPTRYEILETMRDGWHLFVSTAATTFYTNSNVFLVGLLAGNVQAGYFSAAERIIRGIHGLLVPVTQAIYPHISALAGESHERALAFVRKSLIWIGLLSFLPSALLLLLAQPIAHVAFGANGDGCTAVLRWIAMLPFVIAVSNVLGIQTMIPLGLDRQLSRIYLVAGLGSLALSIPLIRQYGAPGAGASVLVVELLIVCVMWQALRSRGVNVLSPKVAVLPFTT